MLYIFWLIAYFFFGSFLLMVSFAASQKAQENISDGEGAFYFYVLSFVFVSMFLHEGTSKIVYYYLIENLPNTGEKINTFSAWILVAFLYILYIFGQFSLSYFLSSYIEKKSKIKTQKIEDDKTKSKLDLKTVNKF